MRIHHLLLFLVVISLQNPHVLGMQNDSLESMLDSTRVDSVQVALRLEIAEAKSNSDIRGALECATNALHMAEALDASYLIADAKLAIGSYYDYLGVREEAIVHLMEARDRFASLGEVHKEIRAEMLIGNAYFYLNQFEAALKYSKLAFHDARIMQDTPLIISSMNAVGAAYGNTGLMDSALILFTEANQLAKDIGDPELEIHTYYNMGDVNLYAGRIDDALGIFYDLEQNYDLATHSSKHLASLYNSMTRAFIQKEDMKWARRYLEKSRQALNTYTRLTESMQFYEQCYLIEHLSGDSELALQHYLVYTELKDSLNNTSFRERLLNLEIFFDMQAKDSEIERLTLDNQLKDLQIRQRKTINYATLGGLVLLFTIVFLVVRSTLITRRNNRILQEQKKELEEANHLVRSQWDDLQDKNNELESVIDELKATQQHLVQSEKMASLGTLTAGIAHEINNPLNFISGGLGLIKEADEAKDLDEAAQEERRRRALKMAQDGLERTTGIVRALMTFSHKGTSKKVESDLHEIIDNTLLFLHSKIKGRVDIQKDYQLDQQVKVFPEKLHQVIMNIIDNAIQAVAQRDDLPGTITIQTSRVKEHVHLEISNNGPAIPKKIISQLFDPFFTTKEPGKGTGLGLSISYKLVEDHGGRLGVKNKDGGVSFLIEIPATTK